MTWYDVEDVLFDGTKEEIENLRCPDCNFTIKYNYDFETNSLVVRCKKCGYVSRSNGCEKVPNCSMLD